MKNYLFLGLLSFISFALASQDFQNSGNGKYFIEHYDNVNKQSNQFSTNFVGMGQNSDNQLFLATDSRTLFFANKTWKNVFSRELGASYPISKTRTIKGIGTKTYVGGQGHFGYFTKVNPYQGTHFFYTSISNSIPKKDQNFGNIHAIEKGKNSIFIAADNALFEYFPTTNQLKAIVQNKYSKPFNINNELWLWQPKTGILKRTSTGFKTIISKTKIEEEEIINLLSLGKNQLLIVGKNQLFYWNSNIVRPFHISNSILKTTTISQALLLTNGAIAISTADKGVFIINKQGQILEWFNQKNGLLNNEITNLFIDNQQRIWIIYNNGISRLEYPSPMTFFDASSGVPKGETRAIVEYQGSIYFATEEGLYSHQIKHSNASPFQKINEIPNDCHSLSVVNDRLLVATSLGVFEIKNTAITQLNNQVSLALFHSKIHPEIVFVGLKNGVGLLKKEQNTWQFKVKYTSDSLQNVRMIVEDKRGDIWLGTDFTKHGIWKISFDDLPKINRPISSKSYPLHFYESNRIYTGSIKTLLHNDELFAVTNAIGSWWYIPSKDSMVNHLVDFPQYHTTFIKKSGSHHFNNTGKSFYVTLSKIAPQYFFLTSKINWENAGMMFHSQNEQAIYPKSGEPYWSQMLRRQGGFDFICFTDDGLVFYVLPNGVIMRYDSRQPTYISENYKATIEEIYINNDLSGNVTKWVLPSDATYHFDTVYPYDFNNILVKYDALSTQIEQSQLFKLLLLYDHDTVRLDNDWRQEQETYLYNLREGDYTIIIFAKDNITGNIAQPATFRFTILPPWYRTIWAYGLYILLGVLFFYLTYFFYKRWDERRQLFIEQTKLKQLVAERTQLLEEQKAALETKNTQIETLLTELNHRVKNNLQMISSLLYSQLRRMEDTTAKAALKTGNNRVQTISLLHEMLYKGNHPTKIEIKPYLLKLLEYGQSSYGNQAINIETTLVNYLMDIRYAVPLGLIVNELISNVFKYAFVDIANPQLSIQLSQIDQKSFKLIVRDNGVGLPPNFNIDNTTSYGLRLIKLLARSLKGEMIIENREGVYFELRFSV